MARSASDVRKSIIKNIQDTDPSVEVAVGPIYDASIVPLSSEIAYAEERVDKVEIFFSTSTLSVATEEDIDAYATNFTISEASGLKATGLAYFIAFRKPAAGEELIIPEGTLVSDRSGNLIYQVTRQVSLDGDNSSSYFNVTKGWYEIATEIEAINPGEDYNIKSDRIKNLLDSIPGIDAVENRSDIEGGTSKEDKEKKFSRIQNAFEGLDSGSISGLKSITEDYKPEVISDVVVVTATDRVLFKRLVSQLALDLYVIGVVEKTISEENFDITETTNSITFLNQPVISVISVSKNDVLLDSSEYQLEKDTEVFSESTRSTDKLVFTTDLVAGDLITVTYTYNDLLPDLQNNLYGEEENRLFEVDMLIRSCPERYFDIQARLSIASSSDRDTVVSDTTSELIELIETGVAGGTFSPEIIKDNLVENVTGLTNLIFDRFTTTTGSVLDIETITLEKNEEPKLDLDLLTLE